MRQLKRFAAAGAAMATAVGPAVLMMVSAPGAAALPPGVDPSLITFSTILRRCDASPMQYVSAAGEGRATAHIRTAGSGELVADVELAVAEPFTFYEVKLIQMPRPSSAGCEAGSPGTAVGAINTDAAGTGAVTVRGPIASGATGAWISIEQPQPFSQVPDEFYTSDQIKDI